jgi:hypothetical protein
VPVALDREKLLDAFDQIGSAAAAAGTTLHIAVYGGSALMLASNFRFSTEDADVSPLENPWPEWLRVVVEKITSANGWAADWFNDGVAFHLSPLAERDVDHLEFGSFPRGGSPPGLVVYVPTAPYMLALKLKAIRVTQALRGEQERLDILNLMRVVGIRTIDEAIAVLARYFPVSGASAEKQRFLLKNMNVEGAVDAPKYPGGGS